MTRVKGVFYAILLLVVLVVLWFIRRHADHHIDSTISSIELPSNDSEKLVIDTRQHIITEIKRNEKGQEEIKSTFLPPKAAVEFTKNGKIDISARQWGTELVPTVGIAYGSNFTLYAAGTLELFYVQRWEAGAGLLISPHLSGCRTDISISYNAYDNILVGAYVDNHRDAGVIASLKF